MSRRAFEERARPRAQVSGVHEAPTQPAPQVDDPIELGALLGSIPLDALGVAYQPIVDVHRGVAHGHEAQVVCRAESLTDPEELYARATFENTIGELGRLTRERAFEHAIDTRIYVGVHPGELKAGLIVRPDDPLFIHDRPVSLQLSQAAYSGVALHILTELRSRSEVSLVLDDYGAGPSTLKHLLELEPRGIKLARELISGLDRSPRKQAVVCALVSMCQELGIELIAKGVDCDEELSAVIDCGVKLAQGYLLGEAHATPRAPRWPPG